MMKPSKRVKRDVDSSVLAVFWKIAEDNQSNRMSEIEWLINRLLTQENQVDGECLSKEQNYSLKRLLSGLSSNRQSARLGYATALTQLLRGMSSDLMSYKLLSEMISEALPVTAGDTKKEVSMARVGRAMAYLCITHSGLVSRLSADELNEFISQVLSLRKEKSSISVLCSSVLDQIICKVDKVLLKAHVLPVIERELTRGWVNCDADTLLLLISAKNNKLIGKKFLTTHWGCESIVNADNMKSISEIMANTTKSCSSTHPVCLLVLRESLADEETFNCFWSKAVYEVLFSCKESRLKKSLCVELVHAGLALCSKPNQVNKVLSAQLLSYLIQSLTRKNLPAYEESKKLMDDIGVLLSMCSSGQVQAQIIVTIALTPQALNSHVINKTLTSALAKLNCEGCNILVNHLMNLLDKKRSEKSVHADVDMMMMRWCLSSLCSLISHSSLSSDTQNNLLKLLLNISLFTVNKPLTTLPYCDGVTRSDVEWMLDLRISARNALLKSIQKLSPGRITRSRDSLIPLVNHLTQLLQYAQKLMVESKCVDVVNGWKDGEREELKGVLLMISNISINPEESDESVDKQCAFKLLFCFLALQLLIDMSRLPETINTDPSQTQSYANTYDTIMELETCYKKSMEIKSKRKSGSVEEPLWYDVLVELLMSLISEERSLVRVMVNMVFSLISSRYISHTTVKLISDVLKSSSASTDGPLGFEDDDTIDDDDDESIEDMEVEGNADVKPKKKESKDDDEDDDDVDDDDDDDDDELVVDEKLRLAVRSALGHAASKHHHTDQTDESLDDESDVDDEEMFRVDHLLSAAFKGMNRNKNNAKTQLKQKQQQLMHYKMRCLDLVEIIVDQGSDVSLILDLMLPLVDLISESFHAEALQQVKSRATKVYRSICQHKKILSSSQLTSDTCITSLNQLMQKSLHISNDFVSLQKDIADGCVLLLRLLYEEKVDSQKSGCKWKRLDELTEVKDKLETAITDYSHARNNRISYTFIQQLLTRLPVLLWPLTKQMLTCVTSTDVRVFNRTQMCKGLRSMVTKQTMNEMGVREWNVQSHQILTTLSQYMLNSGHVTLVQSKFTEEFLRLFLSLLSLTDNCDVIKKSVSRDLMKKLEEMTSLNRESKKLRNSIVTRINKSISASERKESKKSQQSRVPSLR